MACTRPSGLYFRQSACAHESGPGPRTTPPQSASRAMKGSMWSSTPLMMKATRRRGLWSEPSPVTSAFTAFAMAFSRPPQGEPFGFVFQACAGTITTRSRTSLSSRSGRVWRGALSTCGTAGAARSSVPSRRHRRTTCIASTSLRTALSQRKGATAQATEALMSRGRPESMAPSTASMMAKEKPETITVPGACTIAGAAVSMGSRFHRTSSGSIRPSCAKRCSARHSRTAGGSVRSPKPSSRRRRGWPLYLQRFSRSQNTSPAALDHSASQTCLRLTLSWICWKNLSCTFGSCHPQRFSRAIIILTRISDARRRKLPSLTWNSLA
mmetsp:Transcript_27833/g.70424  ORF Transcript_27833/g.70424 Transcript_27833/m.70424 type:complete len:325 (-) Transcript_27833:310-1284(-)